MINEHEVTFFVKVCVRVAVAPWESFAVMVSVWLPLRIFRQTSAETVRVFWLPSVTFYVRRTVLSTFSVTLTVPPWASVTVYRYDGEDSPKLPSAPLLPEITGGVLSMTELSSFTYSSELARKAGRT